MYNAGHSEGSFQAPLYWISLSFHSADIKINHNFDCGSVWLV
jgi:hypothetical protein